MLDNELKGVKKFKEEIEKSLSEANEAKTKALGELEGKNLDMMSADRVEKAVGD